MENTMIERVAEAILDAVGKCAMGDLDDLTDVLIDGQIDLLAVAQSAIKVMTERTEPMLDAGTAVLWPYVQTLEPGSVSVAVWEAMVDAALGKSFTGGDTFVPIPTPFMQFAKPPQTEQS